MMDKARLLLPLEYLEEAIKAINTAKRRVILVAVMVSLDEVTEPLIEALCQAAQRGVKVNVAGDWFTFSETVGHAKFVSKNSPKFDHLRELERRLKAAKVELRWLAQTSPFMMAGRTHSKWCVADDTVFSFGGVNVYKVDFKQNVDYMFKLQSREMAQLLANEQQKIIKADRQGRRNFSKAISFNDDLVLLDGGFVGSSIIYKQACSLAKQAKSAVYVSQYGPSGKLARLLTKIDTQFYFNRAELSSNFNRLFLKFGAWVRPLKNSYSGSGYLHAKFIIFTMPNGQKIAITGSNNFIFGGVILGTREIALQTANKNIVSQLENFVKTKVK